MNDKLPKDVSNPALNDVDYFFPDSQLIIYYERAIVMLEERIIHIKQKLEAAEKRQKELK